MRFILTLVVFAAVSSWCQAAPKAKDSAGDSEGITDVKSLEAVVQTAKTELDKARSTALIEWQMNAIYVNAKTEISAAFPDSQVAVVRKIDSGKPVAVDGSVRSIHVRWTKSEISVNVSVGDSTLASK